MLALKRVVSKMPIDRENSTTFQPIQLRAFATLADEGSYTRVARRLSYSEPAVHMQIKSLERTIGFPLVRRDGQRVVLTDEGLALLPLVRNILEGNSLLDRAIRSLQPSAPLVIGTGRHSGVFMLMPLLPEFRRMTGIVPELHFLPPGELVLGLTTSRFDLVVAGLSDAVLPREERQRAGILRVPWLPVHYVLVAHPSVNARRLPARPRTATTVFFPDYAFPARARLEGACRRYFPDLQLVKLETADAVKSAVSNGLGAGVLPLPAVQADQASGALSVIADIDFGPTRVHLVHRYTKAMRGPARELLGFLLQHGRARRREWIANQPTVCEAAGMVRKLVENSAG